MSEDTGEAGTSVRNGLVGVARGESVEVSRSVAMVATSKGAATFKQGMTGAVLAGGDAAVTQGYATALVAAGDAAVRQSATQWLFAAGDVELSTGGAVVVAAPRVTMRRGFVGLLAARHAQLEDGARVLLKPTGAAAFGAALGLAFGLAAAVAFGARGRKR